MPFEMHIRSLCKKNYNDFINFLLVKKNLKAKKKRKATKALDEE